MQNNGRNLYYLIALTIISYDATKLSNSKSLCPHFLYFHKHSHVCVPHMIRNMMMPRFCKLELPWPRYGLCYVTINFYEVWSVPSFFKYFVLKILLRMLGFWNQISYLLKIISWIAKVTRSLQIVIDDTYITMVRSY